jgi:hypothetical protein
MSAIPPVDSLLPGQAQVRFMHQVRGLQAMAATLAAKIPICEAVQFAVNERDQPIKGLGVSVAPAHQELCDLLAFVLHQEN